MQGTGGCAAGGARGPLVVYSGKINEGAYPSAFS